MKAYDGEQGWSVNNNAAIDEKEDNMNYVHIKGHLGAAPEWLEKGEGEQAGVKLSVAVSERYFDKQRNEWRNASTQWFKCIGWLPTVLQEAVHLGKGAYVTVSGKLRQHEYQDNSGVKQQRTEIHIDELHEILKRPLTKGEEGNDASYH